MDKKYLFISNKKQPRLANQLYIILHCYLNKLLYINCREKINLLNVNKYIKHIHINNENELQVKKINLKRHNYFQILNVHFTETDIVNFINDTIIKSSFVNKDKLITNAVSIHIRAKDYIKGINTTIYHLNRRSFIEKAIKKIKEYIDTDKLYVFSDDLNYCFENFYDIFSVNFKNIKYICYSQEEDLLNLSFFKYKIIWNSTFSFWSAYIASVLYNNDNIVVAPDFYCTKINILPYFKHWLTIPKSNE